uniref:Trans-acting factor B n=1 Tax=Zygosaccharomyces rouxii TaxID=4956 RepID=REP1_ZYGRO|nr:RecName: Full=Trans-acting factor B; AltName: Full=REP1 [Zygosaccharomyces rouxii]CAA26244.1 unnamed protein product [Zygosaccharomyces rouxii]
MFTSQDARDSRPDRELRMMNDVLMTYPYTVIHLPAQNMLSTAKGMVNIAENYRDYPILAIFYVKYLMKKLPYGVIPVNLEWPEPYVVLNTILKRLKEHKFFANKDKEDFAERLHKLIAPDVSIPESRKDEILGQQKKERVVTKTINENFLDPVNARPRLQRFFEKLHNGTLVENLEVGLCKVEILVSSKAMLGQSFKLQIMAANVRELWVGEMVCNMITNETDYGFDEGGGDDDEGSSVEVQNSQSASPGQDQEAQRAPEAPETSSQLFDKIVSALQDDPDSAKAQLGQCRKLASYLLSHKREQEDFFMQTKDTRARLYLDLKGCLGSSWKFSIYRGVRCKQNGQLKVSLKPSNSGHLSGFWVNIKMTSQGNTLDDIRLQVRCDILGKDTNRRGGSEKDPEDQSETESSG